MTPGEWARVTEMFSHALELDADAQAGFIRELREQDAALAAEIESLLAAYEPDPPDVRDPIEGTQIDRYRIVRRIGAGGMGAVYLALRADAAFEKTVAIKLVQARIDGRAALDRFHAERQILASLDHPNIARLLDGGTTAEALPYFVMDYVEGTRIDAYCAERGLSIDDRIRLFLDVCSAVQYVHQNLVVHRDLKPSNILVTGAGVPKLLDFGIAKLLKRDVAGGLGDATRVDERLMTPRYASPEQVRGEPVSAATDVYALGVVLYELLTGRPPYDLKSEAPADVVRAVCEQEPDKPSAIAPAASRRALGGDLDAILLKALRKEAQRRYGSAAHLADDLRRHLDGLPVSAHADSWRYRAEKFVRRHRAAVAASALILVSLVGGIVATARQAAIARAERARAERQFDDVRRISTSFLFEFHDAIEHLPGSTPARRLLVQRALEYLGKLANEARGDTRLLVDLAEAYLKVGDVQGNPYTPNLGDTKGAADSYQRALTISQGLFDRDRSDPDARRYSARSHRALADVLPQLGQPAEAAAHFHDAIALLEPLAAAEPANARLGEDLAACYQELGDLQGHSGLQNLGDAASAIQSYRRSLALYNALVAADPQSRAARRGVALVQIRIGDMEEPRDNLKVAAHAYRDALTMAARLSESDPTDAEDLRRLALAHRKVGGIEEDLHEYDAALKEYAEAASINERLMRADPANVQAAMSYAISLRWSGDLLELTADHAAALAKYREVLAILERLSAAQPQNITVHERLADMLIVMGRLLHQTGDRDRARTLTARGLTLSRDLAGRPEATPDDLSQYALGFLTCEPAALREPSTALRLAKASVDKSGGSDSDNLDILAQAYFANHDIPRAVATEQQALALLAPGDPAHEPPTRRRIEAQLARFTAAARR